MPYAPPVLNRRQVREVDRRAVEDYGVSSLVLMENAGRGAADLLQRRGARGPVVIVCGKGNNGGDGFVLARHLHLRGFDVRLLLASAPEELTGDAAVNWRLARRGAIPWAAAREGEPLKEQPEWNAWCRAGEWLVDALLGTGASGPPREPYASLIHAMNDFSAPVLALDLPSGLDCDTGDAAEPTVRAACTATFAAAKPGLLNPRAREWVGDWEVLDIGLPVEWIAACAE